MSRGGRKERLARHLCACARHWPRDNAEERRLWAALPFRDRDYWRFIADRALAFLNADDVAEERDAVRTAVAGLLDARFDQAGERLPGRPPPPPPTPTACGGCGTPRRSDGRPACRC